MTYFPLRQTTCFFIPLVAPCKPLLSYWNKENTYEITKDYHISFGEEAALLEKGFPLPVLQIEIEANIPWVLDEECSY